MKEESNGGENEERVAICFLEDIEATLRLLRSANRNKITAFLLIQG